MTKFEQKQTTKPYHFNWDELFCP